MNSLLLLMTLAGPDPCSPQPPAEVRPSVVLSADTIPVDTYTDPGARSLIERAKAAREVEEGIESYEGLLRERIYLGLSGLTFRRERGLHQSERVARVRWDRGEGRTIQWIGDRSESAMFGSGGGFSYNKTQNGGSISLSLGGEERTEENQDALQATIVNNLSPFIFNYRPGDDRLVFGEYFALHPLADSAAYHYRYSSGDTLTIHIPSENRTVTLAEVLVEPRRSAHDLLAGSLWFDTDTGALVRATYKPGRPFELGRDGDEDENVPGFLQPFEVEFEYFTVEYSLQDFRWWLPRRFGLEGTLKAGRLVRIPMALEWSVSDYSVNSDVTQIVGIDEMPEGWISKTGEMPNEDSENGEDAKNDEGSSEERAEESTQGDDPDERLAPAERVRVVVPPVDMLKNAPELTGEMLGPSALAFSDAEIHDLKGRLETLIPARTAQSRFRYGLDGANIRYNRVEGLGLGVSAVTPLGPGYTLEPQFRIGIPEFAPRGALSIHRGSEGNRLTLAAYRRLAHTDDFGNPLSLGASLSNFVFRNSHSSFYQTTGAEFVVDRQDTGLRLALRFFGEDHKALDRETNFYLWEPFTNDSLPQNLLAEEGRVAGMATALRWQLGLNPARGVVSGLLRGEVTVGDFAYQRALASITATRSLALGAALGLEVAAGRGWGELPVQKGFFLGGTGSLRGYRGGYASGDSFWMARTELGTALPMARVSLFSDMGWAGTYGALSSSRALWSAGVGVSLLDGLVRADFAWPIRGASGTRFYLYLDGIF